MLFHSRPINHFKYVHEWVSQNNGRATLDILNFRLEVIAYNRIYQLLPQFVYRAKERIRYCPDLSPEVNGFIGWMPYFNKRWDAAIDKLAFKGLVLACGKNTPGYWTGPSSPRNVVIKQSKGSFGEGMRGPFRQVDLSIEDHWLMEGEFYEEFKYGRILKTWFWNGDPVCVEIREPLLVTGDGARTVLDLVKHTFNLFDEPRIKRFETRRQHLDALLQYQQATWNTVLTTSQPLHVDYLYGSCLYPENPENVNRIQELQGSALEEEIRECGQLFRKMIPDKLRDNTLFSADGIIDTDGTVWWLEMNCNPMFPPDAYPAMLDSLFKHSN